MPMMMLILLLGLLFPAYHHAFSASPKITHVAVTREAGKNEKLIGQLQLLGLPIEIHELSCIQHAAGSDFDRFELTLYDDTNEPWDYVIVTSPEAANILHQVWDDDASLQPKVAAVGAATAKTLEQHGIHVDFVPSRATAVDLARELPQCDAVLYAASAKAPDTVRDGLEHRSIRVERLNTYDTVSAEWDDSKMAERIDLVCLASPSAVQGWIANTNVRPTAICIGKTTADACQGIFEDIRYPDAPGMEAWVQLVAEAVQQQQQRTLDTKIT